MLRSVVTASMPAQIDSAVVVPAATASRRAVMSLGVLCVGEVMSVSLCQNLRYRQESPFNRRRIHQYCLNGEAFHRNVSSQPIVALKWVRHRLHPSEVNRVKLCNMPKHRGELRSVLLNAPRRYFQTRELGHMGDLCRGEGGSLGMGVVWHGG